MRYLIEYFWQDLDLRRFDNIQSYLAYAGEADIVQALHDHVLQGSSIVITEDADLHLLRRGRCLYIKPSPEYLLCHSIWKYYVCKDDALFASALGLLSSYFCLVRSKNDLRLAHENYLLPNEVTWRPWTSFTTATFPNCDGDSCHFRYSYGVLLERSLTWINRLDQYSIYVLFTQIG